MTARPAAGLGGAPQACRTGCLVLLMAGLLQGRATSAAQTIRGCGEDRELGEPAKTPTSKTVAVSWVPQSHWGLLGVVRRSSLMRTHMQACCRPSAPHCPLVAAEISGVFDGQRSCQLQEPVILHRRL